MHDWNTVSVAEMANCEASSLGKGHNKADEFRTSVACCRIYHDSFHIKACSMFASTSRITFNCCSKTVTGKQSPGDTEESSGQFNATQPARLCHESWRGGTFSGQAELIFCWTPLIWKMIAWKKKSLSTSLWCLKNKALGLDIIKTVSGSWPLCRNPSGNNAE